MASNTPPRQNRLREALERLYDQYPPYFQEYLRRYKEDPTSRVFAPLAEAYRKMGRLDEALQICREGLKHQPDFHGGRVALAKCLFDKQLYDEARVELETVVQLVPENLLAQKILAETHLALGNRPGALHCYRMAQLLSPSDVSIAEKVRLLETGVAVESEPVPAAAVAVDDLVELAEPEVQVAAPVVKASVAPPAIVPQTNTVDAQVAALWDQLSQKSNNEEEPEWDPEKAAEIDALLGAGPEDDDEKEAFQIQHVSHVFADGENAQDQEITTETLGDLYYSQGQFERSLRIYEKIAAQRSTPELRKKLNLCRMRLGVDQESLARRKKIEALQALLSKTREAQA